MLMSLRNLLLTVSLMLMANSLFADMGPKPDNTIEFELRMGNAQFEADSIAVITYYAYFLDSKQQEDTLFISEGRSRGRCNVLWENEINGHYKILGQPIVAGFKIIVLKGNKRFESQYISAKGDKRFFVFDIDSNGTFKDISPFFYAHWSEYFKAFIWTIIIEAIIGLLFFWKLKKRLPLFLLIQLLGNVLTHPFLWYIESHTSWATWILEISILLIEFGLLSLVFRKKIPVWLIGLIVVLANISSWLITGIVIIITGR